MSLSLLQWLESHHAGVANLREALRAFGITEVINETTIAHTADIDHTAREPMLYLTDKGKTLVARLQIDPDNKITKRNAGNRPSGVFPAVTEKGKP